MKKANQFITKYNNILIILLSFVIRLIYIFQTTVGDRQHDLGYATLLNDGRINPGHLGYVEYLVKFQQLPDFDPFSIFSYYHPPLHHIIAAFFLKGASVLGIKEPQVYEAIQIPTFIYSCLLVVVTYYILKLLRPDGRGISIPLGLVAFHPGFIYMTGSINNDMLATFLSFLAVYTTLIWMKTREFKHLIYMALTIGFGIIAKPNAGVVAFPMGIVMLMYLIDCFKSSKEEGYKCFRQYVVFAIISLPIGFSWTIRNLIRFGQTPGVPSSNEQSHQYLFSYPLDEIFGMPAKASIAFPFHAENSIYCHNTWSILFKTSLFTEVWPENIGPYWLILCQIFFAIAVIIGYLCFILAIVRPIVSILKGDKELGAFMLTGYLVVLVTYILFVIKYPFTCSCDFRYVPTAILFSAVALLPTKSNTVEN